MSFSIRSIDQGIEEAIRGFDYHAGLGIIDKNWRSKLRLEDVRFGNIEKSVPAIVFGSLDKARRAGGYKWSMTFYDNACLATKSVSTAELRRHWERVLMTETVWNYKNGTYYRMIKGITFTINKDIFGNGVILGYGTEMKNYKSVSSAKRAVRKLIQANTI